MKNSDLLPDTGLYSYINPQSFHKLKSRADFHSSFIYAIDSGILACLLSMRFMKRITRVSADFTEKGMARRIFEAAIEQERIVSFIGGSETENADFSRKLLTQYPKLKMGVSSHGYYSDNQEKSLMEAVISSGSSIVFVGMGQPRQEDFLLNLKNLGYEGLGISCGAFISQIARSTNFSYYPRWIDKIGLRFLYRMIKEPHTRVRYLRPAFYLNLITIGLLPDITLLVQSVEE